MIDIEKHLTSYHDGGNDYRYAFSKEEVAEIKQALDFYESALKNEDGYLSVMCERKECNNGWIPCSERLPEEYTVLCCDKYGEMIVGHPYFDEVSNTNYSAESDNEMMYDCVAWQPLPQPFKESE